MLELLMVGLCGRTRQQMWQEMELFEPLDFEKGYAVT